MHPKKEQSKTETILQTTLVSLLTIIVTSYINFHYWGKEHTQERDEQKNERALNLIDRRFKVLDSIYSQMNSFTEAARNRAEATFSTLNLRSVNSSLTTDQFNDLLDTQKIQLKNDSKWKFHEGGTALIRFTETFYYAQALFPEDTLLRKKYNEILSFDTNFNSILIAIVVPELKKYLNGKPFENTLINPLITQHTIDSVGRLAFKKSMAFFETYGEDVFLTPLAVKKEDPENN